MAEGNPNYRLVMRRGPQPNQVFDLTGEVSNLGRDITNDIVINDREVSRHHLRFMRGSDGYTIEDLGSTNGTFINGKRVSGAQPLKNGDLVHLGETVTLGFEVVRDGQEPSAPATSLPRPQDTLQSPSSQQAEDAAYRPQQPAPQNPYQPPQPSYEQQAPQSADYADPASQGDDAYQADYAQQGYQQQPAQQDQYAYSGAYGSPPPPAQGYDYDPYAMRTEDGGNMSRWLLFGCLGLLVVCCCVTVILGVVIDTFELYCSVPLLGQVVDALGLYTC